MAEKTEKARRKQELADERAGMDTKKIEIYELANAEGIPHEMFYITKTKSVKNIIDAGRKKHVAATKKAIKNATKGAKGAPPKKMIKDELLKIGYTNKQIGRLRASATLSGVIKKAETRHTKETAKAAKETAEIALKQRLREQLGNLYSSAEYKKPRKAQSENNMIKAFQKRIGTKKAKELKASEEAALKAALRAEEFNSNNIKYKKGNTIDQHRIAALKRKTVKAAKAAKDVYTARITQAALDADIPVDALKIHGKRTASAESRLLVEARKRAAAKMQKNTREQSKMALLVLIV